MKRNILFVDDNPDMLTSLKRMLRSMRKEWNMEFTGSGQEALEKLKGIPFDVVISDIRMPEMDGVELLSRIKELYPKIIRIALSGQSSREVVLRSIEPTHQFLAKPCDADVLISVVKRACELQVLLEDQALTELVTGLDAVPSLPSLYLEIIEELKSPDSSLVKIGDIISKDIGMTAKILQLVNSAFFGLPQHVSTPAQAATLLGIEIIKALVLSVKIFDDHMSPMTRGMNVKRLWDHCNRIGFHAKKLAELENLDKNTVDDAFLAGILHDVGILILTTNLPEKYSEVLRLTIHEDYRLYDAETEVFGKTHADVGGYLMGLWGLSNPIIEAIVYHHEPGVSNNDTISPLTMVHVADAFDSIYQSRKEVPEESYLDMNYLENLGLADRIPVWRKAYEQLVESEANNE